MYIYVYTVCVFVSKICMSSCVLDGARPRFTADQYDKKLWDVSPIKDTNDVEVINLDAQLKFVIPKNRLNKFMHALDRSAVDFIPITYISIPNLTFCIILYVVLLCICS